MHLVTEVLPPDELDPRGQGVHEMLATTLLYVSDGQGAHEALPVPVLCAPTGQGTQACPSEPVKPGSQVQSSFALPATTELEFKGHLEQRAAPCVAYCPGRHRTHEAFPGPFLNVPAWHWAHVPPLSFVNPGEHMQAADVVLAIAELEFGGQFEHRAAPRAAYLPATHTAQDAAPARALKVPAWHGAQASPFAPVYPASHAQSATCPLCGGACEFAGHAVHSCSPPAEKEPTGLYCPSGHATHTSEPAGLYCPSGHVQCAGGPAE